MLAVLLLVGVVRPALLLLRNFGVGEVVDAAGGFSASDPTRLLLVTLVAVVGAFAFPLLRRRVIGGSLPVLRRTSLLVLVVALAVLSAGWLLVAQMSRNGEPDYYFFKYVVGVELVLVTVVVTSVGLLLAGRVRTDRGGAQWLLAGVVVLLAPALVSPRPAHPALLSAHRSVTVKYPVGTTRDALATTLLRASAESSRTPGRTVLMALPPGSTDQASFAQAWLLALTGTWSVGADRVSAPLVAYLRDTPAAARAARQVLSRNHRTLVLVPAADLAGVRSALGDPHLAARVRTWNHPRG